MRPTFVALAVTVAAVLAVVAQGPRTDSSSMAVQRSGNPRTRGSGSVASLSEESAGPTSFAGTWQGVWRGYGVVDPSEKGLPTALSLTLSVQVAANGKLSGVTSTSGFQHPVIQAPSPRLVLGAPPAPVPPPPPPLPAPPPSGRMLNPRIEGHALAFEVKAPDGQVADFRLRLQGRDAGTLEVTHPTRARAYPEFQMTRGR